eukprot:865152-Prymnesium_polylepis.1
MPGVFGRCANPSCKAPDDRLLRYLNNTVCSYGPCQAYASAQVAARRAEDAQMGWLRKPATCRSSCAWSKARRRWIAPAPPRTSSLACCVLRLRRIALSCK